MFFLHVRAIIRGEKKKRLCDLYASAEKQRRDLSLVSEAQKVKVSTVYPSSGGAVALKASRVYTRTACQYTLRLLHCRGMRGTGCTEGKRGEDKRGAEGERLA